MRTPRYLSPTSLSLAREDIDEFYRRYLADAPAPRFPQTEAMSVGSAFDAHVKSYLYNRIYGEPGEYAFDALFEMQVEPHNRDFASTAGKYCFYWYKKHGALNMLLEELQKAAMPPQFELSIQGQVLGVPVLGKPDLFFIDDSGIRTVYDWKVNGYLSKGSLHKHYVRVLPGGRVYKHCVIENGVCTSGMFEEVDTTWAAQIATYAFLVGEEPGGNWVAGIEQLVCEKLYDDLPPDIRVASYRNRVGHEFQVALANEYEELWQRIQSGWVLRYLPEEEARARQAELDKGSDDDIMSIMSGQR